MIEKMFERLHEEIPRISYSDKEIVNPATSIVLVNPKFPHNVGAAIRAASCFAVPNVYITGNRIPLESPSKKGYRLSREERLKEYKDVKINRRDFCLREMKGITPVAIELVPNAQSLTTFEHPENAVYVFGPEDGSLDRGVLSQCHYFVTIPSRHCTNLSAAIYICLYDRLLKSERELK